MRAVIYARYSTDLQSAASIDDQVRLCRERIERDGNELGARLQRPRYFGRLADATWNPSR